MALLDLVPKIFTAQFLDMDEQTNIYRPLMQDRSSELPYGDTIKLMKDTTPDTTYTATAQAGWNNLNNTQQNFKWPDPKLLTGDTVDLVVDKVFGDRFLVTPLQERRLRVNLVAQGIEKYGIAYRNQFNTDARAAFDAVKTDLPANSLDTTAKGRIDVTAANFGNDAHRDAVGEAIEDMTERVDYAHWPRTSTGRWLVVSPAYHRLIRDYIKSKNLNLVQSTILDNAFVSAQVFFWDGWNIIMDDSLGAGKTATDDAKHKMYFFQRNCVSYARELNVSRISESDEWFGRLMFFAMSYGIKLGQPERLYIVETSIT